MSTTFSPCSFGKSNSLTEPAPPQSAFTKRRGSPSGVTRARLLLPYRERMIIYWRLLRRCFAALSWDFFPTRLAEKNVSEIGQGGGLGVYCNWKGVEKLRLAFASWRDSAPFHFLTPTNPQSRL